MTIVILVVTPGGAMSHLFFEGFRIGARLAASKEMVRENNVGEERA